MDTTQPFLDRVDDVLVDISAVIWGPYVLIFLLLLTGIVLTIRLRALQVHKLGPALHLGLLRRKDHGAEQGDVSQFQALTTALAATVGTGNIVGVATAISVGGPGALFWMWITAIFGMASKYTEAFLAVRFRTTDAAGEKSGGPQYYLQRGIRGPLGKALALTFAVFAVLASFGIGNMTQGNSIAGNVEHSFGVAPWITGIVLTVFTLAVLVGGIKSIGRVTAAFVPVMIVAYVVGAVYILIVNAGAIPGALASVFTDAFTGTAATGGFIGSSIMIAMRMGMARGIFSNESGMGSAAIAAASARTTHPVRQGLVSMTQTFIDTIIVVTCTGLVLLTTGTWTAGPDQAATMTGQAFTHGLPGEWGHWIVTIALALFAYSTILGWAYYGEKCWEYLLGTVSEKSFRILWILCVPVGAVISLDFAWLVADTLNALMAIPNLISLLLLTPIVVALTREYFANGGAEGEEARKSAARPSR